MDSNWPANIAPQTPSALYAGVNIIQPAEGPAVLYVRLRGQVYQAVIGVKSRGRIDIPYYDGSVTRDQVNAAMLGRGPVSVIADTGGGTDNTPFNGDLLLGTSSGVVTPVSDELSTMMQQDDNFTHTAPHQNVKAYTEIRYYDGPLVTNEPSGNLVASFPLDQWEGDASTIPQLVGSVYPTINPTDNNTDPEATP